MAPDARKRPQSRTPLTRDRVLNAAIRLADKNGIESLTMRKLARALGVEAMSLYNHVANKGDLVDGIVDLVVSEIELPSNTGDWETAIRECAISAHETLRRHPWACSVVMSPTTTQTARTSRLRYMEWLLGQLQAGGFSPELTYHAYHALDAHILGYTLWQLGHSVGAADLRERKDLRELATRFLRDMQLSDRPFVAQHVEQHLSPLSEVNGFEFGLDLILDGLKRAAKNSAEG
jgi:AcrR family transcriptional regulator